MFRHRHRNTKAYMLIVQTDTNTETSQLCMRILFRQMQKLKHHGVHVDYSDRHTQTSWCTSWLFRQTLKHHGVHADCWCTRWMVRHIDTEHQGVHADCSDRHRHWNIIVYKLIIRHRHCNSMLSILIVIKTLKRHGVPLDCSYRPRRWNIMVYLLIIIQTHTLKHGVQIGCSDTDTETVWCTCWL